MSHLYKARPTTFQRKTIVAGVAAAIGAGSAGLSWSAELEEVVVTARQRAESSQDIPMMVQSISGEDIQKQGITTLEDFSRQVAGLNVQTTTPGQNTIVFRGVSDGGGFLVDPTAAVYLDEQPMSLTSASPTFIPWTLRESRLWRDRSRPSMAHPPKAAQSESLRINPTPVASTLTLVQGFPQPRMAAQATKSTAWSISH